MSRILLERIPALSFYKNDLTAARRSNPIPQLSCVGRPCKLYSPDVVRCTNIGGRGVDVDWKCEADLPDSLRFGRVEVSCEGWSQPGDPYVLKGSCGLEYRLVELPQSLRNRNPSTPSKWFQPDTILSSIFAILWIALLVVFLYTILLSCFSSRNSSSTQSRRPPPSSNPGRGWFPGSGGPNPRDPPPPYTKHPSTPNSSSSWPSFLSGAALGSLGTYLFTSRDSRPAPPPVRSRFWDWERPFATSWSSSPYQSQPARPSWRYDDTDRGEGPSNLRSSTAFGGSRVR